MAAQDETGGANPSYKGYAYQKLVTVWVALKLMFGPNASASEIIVEPASHDDIQAQLDVPAEDADGELTVGPNAELHVQIKFKGAGHWSAQNFADVVNDKPKAGARGPAPRARAKSLLLKEPAHRYVFITNTSVDASLAKGRVSSPGESPDKTFLPANLGVTGQAAADLHGRFALIEGMTRTEARSQIKAMLKDALNVPSQNVDACIARLERMVEDRFLGPAGPLRKTDIEKVAEDHDGGTYANPLLAHYVAPASAAQADQQLNTVGAVLLIGPSGYGKSLTSESLADVRRRATPPFKVVHETAGLPEIEVAFKAPGRVLFHLEDPWGQSALDREGAARWTARLPHLLRQASAEKQFVITSRSEIYREALTETPAHIWTDRTVVIDDASYDKRARRKILHGSLKGAGSWRQDFARQHETRLLSALRSPLELTTFALELKAVAMPVEAVVENLIDRAQTASRKQVVTDHVRGFGDPGQGGAAILWALMRLSRPLDRRRLSQLRRKVDAGGGRDWAMDSLADHLALTQLQANADGELTAHSKVVEALESLARTHRHAAERALNDAARAAAKLAAADPRWMDELQRFADGVRQLKDNDVVLADDVIDALDAFLIGDLKRLASRATRFRTVWQAAAWRLSDRTPQGQLVSWLGHGAPREKGGFSALGWRAPDITAADREAVLAVDPDLDLVRGFVTHVLPWTSTDYDADQLLPWLKAFGVDLTEAFLAGCAAVAEATDFRSNADTLSEGALAWPNPPYEKVWELIETMDDAVDALLAASAEERRQAWQGERDFAEQIAIQERTEDEGPSAEHLAKGYVRARRRQEGFDWLPAHPRPAMLMSLWAETMRFHAPKPTAEELDRYFEAAGDNDWRQSRGQQIIGEGRLEFGRARIETALASGGPRAVDAAVTALAWLDGDGHGRTGKASAEAALLTLIGQMAPARAALLAPEIVGLELGGPKKKALAARVVTAAGPASAAVQIALADSLKASDATLLKVFRQLAPGEAAALIANGPRRLARRLLVLSAAEGLDVLATASQWLRSGDETDAGAAVTALAHLDGSEATAGLMAALKYADYRVRRHAIAVLTHRDEGVARQALLDMAEDPSAPVRESLAEVLGRMRWPEGLPTLVALLSDRRNYARHPEHQHRDEPEYHVARAAAAALGRFDPLPPEIVDQVIDVLDARPNGAVDVEVHTQLLGLLTAPDNPRIWATLERGLRDGHVVGGPGENLYPIRYAAAWAAVYRLGNHPTELQLAPWPALREAAGHIDPHLAAPGLLALGYRIAADSDGATVDTLRGAHSSEARIALALVAIDDPADAGAVASRFGLLPRSHPLFDNSDDLSTDAAELSRWPLSTTGRAWLESLQGGEDVEGALLWAMSKRTGLAFVPDDFNNEAVRRKATIPITTTAELFGME